MSLKLLIIRFSSIGDIVLTSPVVRCIATQVKDVEIHFLTKKRFAVIVESNPYVTRVHTIDKDISEVMPLLRQENFDHVIDLHKNLRTSRVHLALRKPFSSFNKLNIEKWLMVRFKINRLPAQHIVDRYLKAASFLNLKNDGKGLDFFINDDQKVKPDAYSPKLTNGYIAIVIGGNHNTKIFPADMVADVCNQLTLPVILLGGTEDQERGEVIHRLTGGRALNLCGKLSLMQSASIVDQAVAVMSNDTGLMHIAAALNKPIVSIWGNTIPEFGMYPYLKTDTPSYLSEVKNLSCRPCSKIGFKECPLKHFNCMRMQDVKSIAGFINGIAHKHFKLKT